MHQKLRTRAKARRGEIASELQAFYGALPDGYGFVEVDGPLGIESTSLVSATRWLARRDDLRRGDDLFRLRYDACPPVLDGGDRLYEAALDRLAEIVVTRTRFVDAPIFRLTDMPSSSSRSMEFALDTFSRYALSWDLLESEVCELVTGERTEHDLRQRLLPSADALLSPNQRVCAGGGQALCAFARPAGHGQRADYVLLIQERSSRVVNASGLLATIPKCFHQPMTDAYREVSVAASLRRELEEELFGREELDGSCPAPVLASPMHPSRMSEPMRWLANAGGWEMALTGFSLNSVTGNYEVPALIVVHDEDFWSRYGGAVEANWEASHLRTYSSLDGDGLAALIHALVGPMRD